MLNTLAIDTSSDITFVTLGLATGKFISLSSEAGKHDSELALMVQQVLTTAGIEPEQVERVVVGAGPGSFTGLRIGFSFAAGFAQAINVKPQAIVSLRAFAEESDTKLVISLVDARRSEMFFAAYCRENGELTELEAPQIFDHDRLHKYLLNLEKKGYAKSDISLVYSGEIDLPQGYNAVKPQRLAEVIARLATNEMTLQSEFVPLYIRKVAAKTIAERQAEGEIKA